MIIDARFAGYIDQEIIEYIQAFCQEQAKHRKIAVNLLGFKDDYKIHDKLEFIKITTYDAQSQLGPLDVLNILLQGNQRFMQDKNIHRSHHMDIQESAKTQHPIAIVLGCIDSRVPVETIFDLSLGDIFCVRIAGNVVNNDILASLEYGCQVVGAKLIVVLGHSKCGAIMSACQDVKGGHITQLLEKIEPAISAETTTKRDRHGNNPKFVHQVTQLNIAHSLLQIYQNSSILRQMLEDQQIGMIGACYEVNTGEVKFSDYHVELEQFQSKNLQNTIQAWYHKKPK